jgi:hypothetical protein
MRTKTTILGGTEQTLSRILFFLKKITAFLKSIFGYKLISAMTLM